jgi:hypothetical protein
MSARRGRATNISEVTVCSRISAGDLRPDPPPGRTGQPGATGVPCGFLCGHGAEELAPQEGQQVGVDLILMRGRETVGCLLTGLSASYSPVSLPIIRSLEVVVHPYHGQSAYQARIDCNQAKTLMMRSVSRPARPTGIRCPPQDPVVPRGDREYQRHRGTSRHRSRQLERIDPVTGRRLVQRHDKRVESV